ncbi:MAG: hypothetical protein GXN91_04095 [Epsilonproteobacteria bacterium]|nr:hypothetical protein [Campylobacterota bacterium]
MRVAILEKNELPLKGVLLSSVDEFFSSSEKFDILIIGFDFFGEVYEIRNFFKGYIIFLSPSIDRLIFKKALEVGDFCYTYSELYKVEYRLEYLKRRIYKTASSTFKYRDILYNFNTKTLYKGRMLISLTLAQQELLELLIKYRGRFLSLEDIVDLSSAIGSASSVKVIISSLRKIGFKIISKQNQGYQLKESD